MIEKETNHNSAGRFAFFAARDASFKSAVNSSKFSEKQKVQAERSFANLAMGFNKVSEKDIDSFVSLEAFYKSESFRKQPKEIIELLEMFKNETLF